MAKSDGLPSAFRARYILSGLLEFAPVLVVWLIVVERLRPGSWGATLLLQAPMWAATAWFAVRRAGREASQIAQFGREDPSFAVKYVVEGVRSNVLPLAGAVIILGTIASVTGRDIRFLAASAGVGLLLGVGLALKWLVYGRWMVAELRRRESRAPG